MPFDSIEINEQFKRALDLMENTDKNIFITGKAGTGKSTLLEYFRYITKKNIVVLAPTGVAALNVHGQTIHSFFRFKTNITLDIVKKNSEKGKEKIYKVLNAVIIDEISMVRADLLDCVDKALRINCGNSEPFGGRQMIFFGDLYQLPPVITSKEKEIFTEKYSSGYFFSAEVMDDIQMELIELEKIYRQKDETFIKILNAIRNNSVTEEDLAVLNKRYDSDFEPDDNEFYIHLTTRNDSARRINESRLDRINGKVYRFDAFITGEFYKSSHPADETLLLKKDAQVMFLNNDSMNRWVNGTIGTITDISKYDGNIHVQIINGDEVDITPHKWELFNYIYNADTKSIETEKLGSFTQFPLRLAWAVTIHKSQGKTFERVIIDIRSGTFTSGQVYVGLSRCISLEGIVLKQKIKKKHIFMDWKVVEFMTSYQYKISDKNIPLEKKIEIIKNIISRKGKLEIVYLKTNDVKSKRIIRPEYVGEMEYLEKTFTGIEAYCYKRNETRHFRVDRILEMKEID